MAKAFISQRACVTQGDYHSNTTRIRWRDWTGEVYNV
jgi:hypothetical protein